MASIFRHFGSLWEPIWASWGIIWAALIGRWSVFCSLSWRIFESSLSLLTILWLILVPPGLILETCRPYCAVSGGLFWSPSEPKIHRRLLPPVASLLPVSPVPPMALLSLAASLPLAAAIVCNLLKIFSLLFCPDYRMLSHSP